MDDEAKVKGALIKYQMSLDASALPLQTSGEAVATVVWHDPVLDILPPKAGKIIDASIAFLETAPLGTKLFTSAQISVEAVERIVEKHCNAYLEDQQQTLEDTVRAAVLEFLEWEK
ncbi:MAG TPA: hypothetical protein VK602_19115 [Phyllobacterium sp.]|nr:hypothetical protein [Phyllobacterium sp.]